MNKVITLVDSIHSTQLHCDTVHLHAIPCVPITCDGNIDE